MSEEEKQGTSPQSSGGISIFGILLSLLLNGLIGFGILKGCFAMGAGIIIMILALVIIAVINIVLTKVLLKKNRPLAMGWTVGISVLALPLIITGLCLGVLSNTTAF